MDIIYRDTAFKKKPHTITIDGITYNGGTPPADKLKLAGFYPCIEAPKPAEGFYKPEWAFDGEEWAQTRVEYVPEPERFEMSKLRLYRALRASGMEDVLRQLFAASPEFEMSWICAVTLRNDDPELLEALEAFKALVPELTDEVIQATFEEARII